MKKCLMSLVFITCMLGVHTPVHAQVDQSKPLEEFYAEYGYKSLEEAVKEFEQQMKMKISLPKKLPSLSFTHVLARVNRLGGNENVELNVEYLNEHVPENHFKMDIRPAENKLFIHEKRIIEQVRLKTGGKGIFVKVPGFHVFIFETEHCQYRLSMDQRVSDHFYPDELVEIAKTIDSE
ncbi:hypothetical protein DXT76_21685 [Halobacillus trueperi]|uniref:DUF3888 domain-containing protein n=1 Tax=Halobacillus trueperi TaxID=156205 RepID=A0A3D8V9U1_9BACI|nr:hypothetical protein [Halobacillus trueperi]RDY65811.1 hypothetical protein DXT76_21685 [Halobacillus trueperi]